MKPTIPIANYTYSLPDEKIARFPLDERDASKLLLYRSGAISEANFVNLVEHLPISSLLVFNNTKVIHARLIFRKESGARIEVFCLEPVTPHTAEQALASSSACEWKCTVGNLKKWKSEILSLNYTIGEQKGKLTAKKTGLIDGSVNVRFLWNTTHTFGQLMEACGQLPIPPYLKREAGQQDEQSYQTVYARNEGSVAAPTAGLHFSDRVLALLSEKGIEREELTLHVGAGTFKPVKAETIDGHEMHCEHFTIKLETLKHIRAKRKSGKIIAVGTTSVRTLESLYYIGINLKNNAEQTNDSLEVKQWEPYENIIQEIDTDIALAAIECYMQNNRLNELNAKTSILIVPGYRFKLVSGLVTNFHQPQSTLLLLIAALIGNDWRKVYSYALTHNFRFLSYGDSSLLLP